MKGPKVRVSVFGSSMPRPGGSDYEEAFALGTLIGQNGYTVLTGGYGGTMEAVSRGGAEAGGHTIGVTCKEIEAFRPGQANKWVAEEIQLATLQDRLMYLISNCDAAIALPGGIGTLAEIILLWNKMQVRTIPPRPFTLVGTGWKSIFDTLLHEQDRYIPLEYRSLIHTSSSIEAAFTYISRFEEKSL